MRSMKCSLGCSLFFQRFGAVALAILFCASPAAADYPIQAGDVVEVSIGGLVDFHQRAVVQQDGTVNFPQLGTISVDGSLASQLRTRNPGSACRQNNSSHKTARCRVCVYACG